MAARVCAFEQCRAAGRVQKDTPTQSRTEQAQEYRQLRNSRATRAVTPREEQRRPLVVAPVVGVYRSLVCLIRPPLLDNRRRAPPAAALPRDSARSCGRSSETTGSKNAPHLSSGSSCHVLHLRGGSGDSATLYARERIRWEGAPQTRELVDWKGGRR